MAVTVVKRPTGHKIIDQVIEAMITDSSGDALISFPYHALDTGDTVYITSDIDEYNGFWLVTVIDVNSFKISELEGGLGTLVFTPWVLNALPLWGSFNTSAQAWFWTGGIATPFLTVPAGIVAGNSDWFGPTGVAFETGRTYKYGYTFTAFSDITDSVEIKIVVGDGAFAILIEKVESVTATVGGTVVTGTYEFVAPSGALRFAVVVNYPSGAANDGTIEINSFVDLTEDVYEGGTDFVEYYQDADIDYYQTQVHDWNSIFLPIVYKVYNDKWPTNSVDAVNLIVLNSDDNGFTSLTLASPFSANALEFLTITGATTEEANGVWQIVDILTSNVVVINLPYEFSGNLIGAGVQYYYNNYQVKVKIFAGLNATSPWESKKPYEEVAELSLTPDEDNLVMFSISDYIKMKVAIKNNLLLFSLPLNLDAFTGFYISTAESYDDSDNYSLTTNESSFTQDTFEGYAIAGKLEFKNVYSGDYADFVYTSGSPARWLTNRSRLLAVEGYYFDISFIKNIIGEFFVRFTKYISDYGISEDVAYTDQGIGVYRIPVTADANYDSFCVQAFRGADSGFVPAVMADLDTWANVDTGGLAWTLVGSVPTLDTNGLGFNNTSDDWHVAYAFEAGRIYSFNYTFFGLALITVFHIDIVDASDVLLTSAIITIPTQTASGNYSFLAPAGAVGITIWMFDPASCGSGAGFCEKRIVAFTNETTGSGGAAAFAITEEICIDMLEACDVQDGFVSTEGIRLLEDGGYRLLE